MRIFLYGDCSSNTGPANVNKALISNKKIIANRNSNKFIRQFSNLYNIFLSSTIVFSGIDRLTSFYVNLSKLLNKKIIYLMHGYVTFENEYNKLNLSNQFLAGEETLMKKCDLILPVSENFSKWFIEKRPEFKWKMHFLTNGIDANIASSRKRTKRKNNHELVATGGNRNLKNNKMIANAVESLNANGYKCSLKIYGRFYSNNEKIEESKSVKLKGMVSQEELYNQLENSKLYVLNTTGESFSLSVIEALMCGCNVLISKNAGVCSILTLSENDIIYDYSNLDEISNKIKYNLENDNNERILKSLDIEHYLWNNVSIRLINICECLENNRDYKNIR